MKKGDEHYNRLLETLSKSDMLVTELGKDYTELRELYPFTCDKCKEVRYNDRVWEMSLKPIGGDELVKLCPECWKWYAKYYRHGIVKIKNQIELLEKELKDKYEEVKEKIE